MFRHKGQNRTFKHNLRLAILLSSTAGIVNVAGFISFSIFTTNVTGHVAQFSEQLSLGNFSFAKIIVLWMLMFLFGAFFSSFLINIMNKRAPRFSHSLPLLIEIFILLYVGYLGQNYNSDSSQNHFLAGSLLFAMGMQNAMVTMVSGFVVRTTHLTGLFTDLGIEISKLFYLKDISEIEKKDLKRKLLLHSSIVIMFIVGGVVGSFMYKYIFYKTFIVAALILLFALFYDGTRIRFYLFVRKYFRSK